LDNDLLKIFVGLFAKACEEQVNYRGIGSANQHITSIELTKTEEDGYMFKVTTWDEVSEDPVKTRNMGLVELMSLIGRLISSNDKLMNEACLAMYDHLEAKQKGTQ
jgi:hypothetical protein